MPLTRRSERLRGKKDTSSTSKECSEKDSAPTGNSVVKNFRKATRGKSKSVADCNTSKSPPKDTSSTSKECSEKDSAPTGNSVVKNFRKATRGKSKSVTDCNTSKSPPETRPETDCVFNLGTGAEHHEIHTCTACNKKYPPIPRYTTIYWIQCDNCDLWWHIDCVCIAKRTLDKYEKYKIPYACAKCVCDSAPWLKENIFGNCTPHAQTTQNSSDRYIAKSTDRNSPDTQQQDDKPCSTTQGKVLNNRLSTVVVDGIEDPRQYKSSVDIKKEAKRYEPLQSVRNCFSLPCGGIALQFESDQEAGVAIEKWPDVAFSPSSVPHRPRDNSDVRTGYLKNVDISLPTASIEAMVRQHCPITSVERLYHKDKRNPMPVVRIQFPTPENLQKAVQVQFDISLHGKKAFLEPQRGKRIIRCYNCHRFGHVARSCVHDKRCESCPVQDPDCNHECRQQEICPNCGGQHKASYNKCPAFLEVRNRMRLQRFL
jgi:hypothetical protein